MRATDIVVILGTLVINLTIGKLLRHLHLIVMKHGATMVLSVKQRLSTR